jgi:hypothetical protein
MSDTREILGQRDIVEWLKQHPDAKGRLKRAATQLKDKPDAIAAVRKLLPSLVDNVVKVFFSYKKVDERAATAIVEVLSENAADKLEITYMAGFAEQFAGQRWREQISKGVRSANWFILLLPDPSDELDWCLFETGLFEAQLTSADRLICLHHPDTEVPHPIQGYQAIAATLPEAEKFLRMVFVGDDPVPGMRPINRALEKRIPELAQRMVDAIRVPKRRLNREVFEPWIEMSLVDATQLEQKEDLDSACIVSANAEALELFGFRDCPKTFAKLREEIEEKNGDGRWREELFHVLRKIANGNTFSPIQAVFRSRNGKMFRPIAMAIDRAGPRGPVQTYHITFAEEVTTTDMAAMPRKLALLATLLRFAFRFRWEVLEPFSRGPLNDADVTHLDVSLKRIKCDWESRGTIDQSHIMDLFTGEQRRHTEEMFKAWGRLRNPDQTGELDIAIKNRDARSIPALLSTMLPANQQFLQIAAGRFAEMVAETHEVVDFSKAQPRSVAA